MQVTKMPSLSGTWKSQDELLKSSRGLFNLWMQSWSSSAHVIDSNIRIENQRQLRPFQQGSDFPCRDREFVGSGWMSGAAINDGAKSFFG